MRKKEKKIIMESFNKFCPKPEFQLSSAHGHIPVDHIKELRMGQTIFGHPAMSVDQNELISAYQNTLYRLPHSSDVQRVSADLI